MRSLATKAYRRCVSYIDKGQAPPMPIIVEDYKRPHTMQSVPLPSWREKLREWRSKAASVFRMQRGQ